MLRTALYVYQPSTVTIRAEDPRDAGVLLYRFNQEIKKPAPGVQKLNTGIYLIVSIGDIGVTGPNVEVMTLRNDKDPWPAPKATVIALEPGATVESVKNFFTVAKAL